MQCWKKSAKHKPLLNSYYMISFIKYRKSMWNYQQNSRTQKTRHFWEQYQGHLLEFETFYRQSLMKDLLWTNFCLQKWRYFRSRKEQILLFNTKILEKESIRSLFWSGQSFFFSILIVYLALQLTETSQEIFFSASNQRFKDINIEWDRIDLNSCKKLLCI